MRPTREDVVRRLSRELRVELTLDGPIMDRLVAPDEAIAVLKEWILECGDRNRPHFIPMYEEAERMRRMMALHSILVRVQ